MPSTNLSFSRAAVRQVTDRMQGILNREQRSILEVRTFHSFFLDLVRSHGRLFTGAQARFITPEREAQLRPGPELAHASGSHSRERVRAGSPKH